MSLADLRARLEALDRHLIELVAQRQALAREVGALKDRDASALRDFGQEKAVLDRAREAAGLLGVTPELAESLMRLLIESSLTVQERQRVETRGVGDGRRALVIGGSGRMGDWFARFLHSQGFSVEIADPVPPRNDFPHVPDWRQLEVRHDVIVVAATLRESALVLEDLAERPPPGLVFDIGSLKSPLRAALKRLAGRGARVTSLHPMFGPDTMLLSGRHVVLVDLGHADANREAAALFEGTMATVVPMDLESHDRVVAYVLGLSHAINIVFFTALAESGEGVGHLAHLSSTTFDSQLQLAARVAQENPHLYFEIQHLNDYGTESLSALLLGAERLRSIVRSGDEAAFVRLFESGQRYLATRGTE